MAMSAIGAKVCQNLQADYFDYFRENAPEFKTGGDTATIKYLLSPQNRANFKQINVATIPGKKRAVAFQLEVPMCFDVTKPGGVICTTARGSIVDPSKEVVFSLGPDPFRVTVAGVPQKLTISEEEMNTFCTEDDQSYMKRKILKYLRRFEEALNAKIALSVSTSAGTNAAGAALTRLPFFVLNTATQTSAINSDAIWQLDQNYRDIMGQGQYALLGGKVLNKLQVLQKWTGLNQAGIDLSKLDDMDPYTYYDRNYDSILGGNGFMQLSPGAIQLVTWNKYAGERRKAVTDLYTNDTVVSPLTGLPIDFKWRFDYDCDVYTFEPFSYTELAVNIAGGCNNLATTNGVIKVEDCSSGIVAPVCPA